MAIISANVQYNRGEHSLLDYSSLQNKYSKALSWAKDPYSNAAVGLYIYIEEDETINKITYPKGPYIVENIGSEAILTYLRSFEGSSEIDDGSVTTDKIANSAVTEIKLSDEIIQKLNSGGPYTPNAGDDDLVDLQSVKAKNLKGKSYNEVLDILLFPEYNASAGILPSVSIYNPSLTLEVGKSIENASYSFNEGTQYEYIKEGSSYNKKNYTYTTPIVTTTKSSDKVQFGVNTRETAATSYTVTGPDSDKLYEGEFLYKSKGTGSNVKPLAVGTVTKPLDATSVTITGVYKGGKDNDKTNDIYINLEGKLASTISGPYKDNLTYILSEDTASKPDHSFSTLGSKSVELFVPTGKSYTVKLTATKFNSGNNSFENDRDLTASLDSLTVNLSPKTFQDAAENDYTVTSYLINTSNIKTEGKFIVKMKITKNQ